ncbi:Synaptic vesicle glycoprotein 2B, partial [Pseudolycoriella hygida]
MDHEISLRDGVIQRCYTFEEAIKVTGHGKFHYFVLCTTGVSLAALVGELIGIGYSGPSAKCDMKFTTSQQGILNSVAFLGFVCSSHLWGFMSDTWGRQKSLRLSLLCTFIFSALSSVSITIAMLITTRFFVGFSNQTRPRAITFASMCMTLAVVLMSLLSWAIIPMQWSFSLGFIVYTPWRFNILCIGLISLLAFIMLGFLPESPKFLLSLGKEQIVIKVLTQIYRANNRGTRANVTSFRNVANLMWNQTWPLFRPPHLKNMLLISYLSSVLYGIAHGMNMWLPHIFNLLIDYIDDKSTMCDVIHGTMGKTEATVVEAENNTSTTECTNIANPLTFKMMLIFGLYLLSVYVAVGIFIKWVTIKTITSVGLLASTICGAALIWSYNFYFSYFFLCVLLSCGNFASLLGGLCQDLFPTNLKSMAVCFIFMFGRIGSVAGSNLIGLLITTNCTLVLIIYAVILC